jgi:hypothetical protein
MTPWYEYIASFGLRLRDCLQLAIAGSPGKFLTAFAESISVIMIVKTA